MRRSMSSEIIAAAAVITVIAFAVVFGVLLSSSDPETVAEQPTLLISDSNVQPEDTEVVTGATVTPNLNEAEEGTPEVTLEPEPTASATVEMDTTPESTNEVEVTATATDEPEPTVTAPVEEATATVQPTIPSATADDMDLETATSRPTMTATEILTLTATSTATASPIPTLTPTRTPMPVETSGILPTPTQTPGATVIYTPVAGACVSPAGWVSYVVLPGNTLFSIAQAVGSSVGELRSANCLPDVDRITVGDVLFVPRQPANPVQPAIPTPQRPGMPPVRQASALGCLNPGVQITQPAANSRLSGSVTLRGSATWPDFGYYKIEVRLDNASVYNFIAQYDSPVASGQLGVLNSNLFNPGLHWIRLVVVDATGNVPDGATCVIPVMFE